MTMLVHYEGVTGGPMYGLEPEGGPLVSADRRKRGESPAILAVYAVPPECAELGLDALARMAETGQLERVVTKGKP